MEWRCDLRDRGYVIRDAKKREVKLMVDGETTGDTKLETGDYIKAKVTRQGRAIAIAKEAKKDEQDKRAESSRLVAFTKTLSLHCQHRYP